MAHTPGPWEARPNDGQIVLNGSNCYDIREIYNDQGGFNPDDIRLMGAAQEMLTVLRRVIDMANCAMEYEGVVDAHTLNRALERIGKAKRECERVVAKAEGRE